MMLFDEIKEVLQTHPLIISSTSRAGNNGLKNADEITQAILDKLKDKGYEIL